MTEILIEVSEGGAIVALAVLLWKQNKKIDKESARLGARIALYREHAKTLYAKNATRIVEHIQSRMHK